MTGPVDDKATYGTVGTDVVRRAELRYFPPHGPKPEFVEKLFRRLDRIDGSRQCIVCHYYAKGDGAWRRSTVGGRDVAVCDRCVSLALTANLLIADRVKRAVDQFGMGNGLCGIVHQAKKDARQELRSCLSLLAMAVERACDGHVYDEFGRLLSVNGHRLRIEHTFGLTWYAEACNCPAHKAAREPESFDRSYTKPEAGVHDVDSLVNVTTRPPNYLEIIRSFPDKVRYQGEVVKRDWLVAKLEKAKKGKPQKGGALAKANRSAMVHPGIKPGGLADQALKSATRTNAGKWQAIHEWERARNEGQPLQLSRKSGLPPLVRTTAPVAHPAFAEPKKPDAVVLDDSDVDTLLKAFTRDQGDNRFYCDFCGDFHAVMKMPTGVFICAPCRLDARTQRLVPVVEAVRQGKLVTWFDHAGYPDE